MNHELLMQLSQATGTVATTAEQTECGLSGFAIFCWSYAIFILILVIAVVIIIIRLLFHLDSD